MKSTITLLLIVALVLVAQAAPMEESSRQRRDTGRTSEPVKPQDLGWDKREDLEWDTEPVKHQGSTW
ncbi:hypothetical protein BGX23_000358, partial [Mortierella sp. AD031]